MTDEQSFLAAICADREADLPRLGFADWLDDRAEPGDAERARFIRLQVQRYRLCETAPLPRIEGFVRSQYNWSRRRDEFPVHVVGKPNDDVPIGRVYELWNPDEPTLRPRVMSFSGDFKRGPGCWFGTFRDAERADAKKLVDEERAILTTCPPWGGEYGKPKCFGWLWLRDLDGLKCTSFDHTSWDATTFERGFPAVLHHVHGGSWTYMAEQILRTCPIEEVRLASWPQVKSHARLVTGPAGAYRATDVWLGDLERFDTEELGGMAPIDLLRRYWPKIRFVPPK